MRKSRENGFDWPLHPYQYLSYGFFFYELLVTCVFLCPLVPPPYQVTSIQYVFIVLYVPLQVAAGLYGIFATKSNPTDLVVYKHRLAKKNKYASRSESFDLTPYTSICNICGTAVSNSSKHCGYCNRCVAHFDHHCKWLNNCIGSSNYALFAGLIGSLEALQVVIFAATVWFISQYFRERKWLNDRMKDILSLDVLSVAIGLIWVQGVIALLMLFAVGNLISVHIWLRKWKKMTTFEYILHLRNRKISPAVANFSAPDLSAIQLVPKDRVGKKGTLVFSGEEEEIDVTKRSRSEEIDRFLFLPNVRPPSVPITAQEVDI